MHAVSLFLPAALEMDPFSAAVESRGMVLVALIALVIMSVLSWVVIGSRLWALHQLRKAIAEFRAEFAKFTDLRAAAESLGKKYYALPHVRLLAAVLKEMHQLELHGPLREVDLDGLERAMRRTAEPLVDEMETGLSLLGTTASAAPFIGLFGTVWGIMGAFGGLADSGSILQTVAPHIAQALVATAVGLLAAIPASMAYNGLGRMVRRMVTDLDGFGLELLNLARRQHLRARSTTAHQAQPVHMGPMSHASPSSQVPAVPPAAQGVHNGVPQGVAKLPPRNRMQSDALLPDDAVLPPPFPVPDEPTVEPKTR